MKAAVRERYGPPGLVRLADLAVPEPGPAEVLVRVVACSVNPYDYFVTLQGVPYIARLGAGLLRPKNRQMGVDFAGVVERVGKQVTRLRPGDEIYGFGRDAFAEYVCAGNAIAAKPPGLSFEEAAAAPSAAITALQAVRDKAGVTPGQRVLINGGAGGVGTFAVQMATAFGAEVTAVCSTANVDLVRSLGAARVIDYTRDDFTRDGIRHDAMIDLIGNRPWSEYRAVLAGRATCVLVGGLKTNRWLGPVSYWMRTRLASVAASQKVAVLLARMDPRDLETINDLFAAGALKVVISKTFPLEQTASALAAVGEGHARGKIVIRVNEPPDAAT